MLRPAGRGLAAATLLAVCAAAARAQCPDGTPPPCGGRAARTTLPTLAVLPFQSVGGDSANVYFAEGLSDELTTALSHVGGLRVIATGTSFRSGGAEAERAGRTQIGRASCRERV
jgi:TolB-like protein